MSNTASGDTQMALTFGTKPGRSRSNGPLGLTTSDWVGTMTDIDVLRGLQGRQQVLMAELQHRTRNLLSVVQAIANQTLLSSESLDSFMVASL